MNDVSLFEANRAVLLSVAYRMLGDLSRAEDVVQEAWMRWSAYDGDVRDARAFLVVLVTRLCLTELGSARARREESRGDRLPEPVSLDEHGLGRIEMLEHVSMAFLVLLQKLTAAERAVLLLHEVFDYDHAEIAAAIGKSASATRKLLERARASLAAEKRVTGASREAHARLLQAFVTAASRGDTSALVSLLAEDALLVTDGGKAGQGIAGVRALREPMVERDRIAAFIVHVTSRAMSLLTMEVREINGAPALVLRREGAPFAVLQLAVADERIHRVFFQADRERLGHVR